MTWGPQQYDAKYKRSADYLPYAELYGAFVRVVGEELSRHASRRVLDLGCGTGFLTRMIGEACHAHVIAIDFSPFAIKHARDQHKLALRGAASAGTVEFTLGDFRALPLPGADVAIASEVLEHLDDDRAFVQRVLGAIPVLIGSVPNQGRRSAMHVNSYDVRTLGSRFASVADMTIINYQASKRWIIFRAVPHVRERDG